MTRFSFCTLTLALCLAANAATVRTASETFVTNKIAAAIAAIPEPDFSPSNATLVATIEETSPSPGDYANVSNKAVNAVQTEADPNVPAWAKAETQPLPPNYSTISNKAMTALQEHQSLANYYNKTETESKIVELAPAPGNYAAVSNAAVHAAATNALQDAELESHASQLSQLSQSLDGKVPTSRTINGKALTSNISLSADEVGATTPADVTAAIREQSLGGIWDAELEVWWTPRMKNGSLTYEATTNVNLNAGN